MRMLTKKIGIGYLVLIAALILGGVKLIADNLVDNTVQGKMLAGNQSLYNATVQMGFYAMEKPDANNTYICYSGSTGGKADRKVSGRWELHLSPESL